VEPGKPKQGALKGWERPAGKEGKEKEKETVFQTTVTLDGGPAKKRLRRSAGRPHQRNGNGELERNRKAIKGTGNTVENELQFPPWVYQKSEEKKGEVRKKGRSLKGLCGQQWGKERAVRLRKNQPSRGRYEG